MDTGPAGTTSPRPECAGQMMRRSTARGKEKSARRRPRRREGRGQVADSETRERTTLAIEK